MHQQRGGSLLCQNMISCSISNRVDDVIVTKFMSFFILKVMKITVTWQLCYFCRILLLANSSSWIRLESCMKLITPSSLNAIKPFRAIIKQGLSLILICESDILGILILFLFLSIRSIFRSIFHSISHSRFDRWIDSILMHVIKPLTFQNRVPAKNIKFVQPDPFSSSLLINLIKLRSKVIKINFFRWNVTEHFLWEMHDCSSELKNLKICWIDVDDRCWRRNDADKLEM